MISLVLRIMILRRITKRRITKRTKRRVLKVPLDPQFSYLSV